MNSKKEWMKFWYEIEYLAKLTYNGIATKKDNARLNVLIGNISKYNYNPNIKTKPKEDYRLLIGDGGFPNLYFVFQYDNKYKRCKDGTMNLINPNKKRDKKDEYLGRSTTYSGAIKLVNDKAFLPNIVIEDRLSGMIFESYYVVCSECGNETSVQEEDIAYTKKTMEEAGYKFE
ncbi:MAG: hypothetical protein WCY30_02325 [Candidatus Neomarinimicrobiota bacterium]|jgi:hypothetical protein